MILIIAHNELVKEALKYQNCAIVLKPVVLYLTDMVYSRLFYKRISESVSHPFPANFQNIITPRHRPMTCDR